MSGLTSSSISAHICLSGLCCHDVVFLSLFDHGCDFLSSNESQCDNIYCLNTVQVEWMWGNNTVYIAPRKVQKCLLKNTALFFAKGTNSMSVGVLSVLSTTMSFHISGSRCWSVETGSQSTESSVKAKQDVNVFDQTLSLLF